LQELIRAINVNEDRYVFTNTVYLLLSGYFVISQRDKLIAEMLTSHNGQFLSVGGWNSWLMYICSCAPRLARLLTADGGCRMVSRQHYR